MAALQSIRPAVGALVRNPILVAITALFGLSQLPNLFVQPTRPLLAAVISLVSTGVLILVVPFFQGGLLGMASEALRGKTGLDTLRAEGRANYVSLLLAYFVLLAVSVVFTFVVVFGVFIGVIGASFGGVGGGGMTGGGGMAGGGLAGGGGWTLLAVIGVIAGGLTLVYLLVTLFVQFYAHAIVLDDLELVDGFRRSVGVVRSNLLAVFGYSVVLTVGGALLGTIAAVGGILSAAWGSASPELPASPLADLIVGTEPTTAMIVGFAAVYVVASGVFGGFYVAYSVAFYESIRPPRPTDTADGGSDSAADAGSRSTPESR